MTIRRWEKLFHKEATLAATGETFAQVSERRTEEMERLAARALELDAEINIDEVLA